MKIAGKAEFITKVHSRRPETLARFPHSSFSPYFPSDFVLVINVDSIYSRARSFRISSKEISLEIFREICYSL